jgi:hypothetical protein
MFGALAAASDRGDAPQGGTMLQTMLIIVLILMLLGSLPLWPHSKGWGYGPSGVVGLALAIVLVLRLLGKF